MFDKHFERGMAETSSTLFIKALSIIRHGICVIPIFGVGTEGDYLTLRTSLLYVE